MHPAVGGHRVQLPPVQSTLHQGLAAPHPAGRKHAQQEGSGPGAARACCARPRHSRASSGAPRSQSLLYSSPPFPHGPAWLCLGILQAMKPTAGQVELYTELLAVAQRVEDTGPPVDTDPLEDAICVVCACPEDEDQTLLCDGAALLCPIPQQLTARSFWRRIACPAAYLAT